MSDTEAPQVWPESNFQGTSCSRWNTWMKNGGSVLLHRAAALLFSTITFVLLVRVDFTSSSDLCYVLSIAVIVMIYTTIFVGIKGYELRTGKVVIPRKIAVWMDFLGDQILALMMISSASSAASANRIAQASGNTELTTQATIAISIAFSAFFSLETAALISGYHFALHLSTR